MNLLGDASRRHDCRYVSRAPLFPFAPAFLALALGALDAHFFANSGTPLAADVRSSRLSATLCSRTTLLNGLFDVQLVVTIAYTRHFNH